MADNYIPLPQQEPVFNSVNKIVTAFLKSDAEIRPHFFLVGPSGSGKTAMIEGVADLHGIKLIEVNAAGLTKEGLSGNSLSKALTDLRTLAQNEFAIIFVDEFDKLIIDTEGCPSRHDATVGVQNEFLTVLEKRTAAVFGDYGKYVNLPVDNCLFVFSGAFNNMPNIDIDTLHSMGIKNEFLGRVPLCYNLSEIDLQTILDSVDTYYLFLQWAELEDLTDAEVEASLLAIKDQIRKIYARNKGIGIRMLNSTIHQWFIEGDFNDKKEKRASLKKTRSSITKTNSTAAVEPVQTNTGAKTTVRKKLSARVKSGGADSES